MPPVLIDKFYVINIKIVKKVMVNIVNHNFLNATLTLPVAVRQRLPEGPVRVCSQAVPDSPADNRIPAR